MRSYVLICGLLLSNCLDRTAPVTAVGACAGVLQPKAWLNIRGAGAKKAFRNLTREGKARGMLAFVGDEPVGCCSFGPRLDFPVLQSIEAYKRDDTGNVWSINRRAEAFGEAATVRIIPLPKSVLKLLCVF